MPVHVTPRRRISGALLVLTVIALVASSCSSSDDNGDVASPERPSARGFDGTTITLAAMGIKSQLPGVETGVQARVKRFNDTNELSGVKLRFAEFVDDKQDPAIALSEARRLVTDVKAFAIVGDVSANNPGEYFAQQHVPYFGYAFDDSYCRLEPDTSIWGFGFVGCLVPSNATAMPDRASALLDLAKTKSGKARPTLALFSTDTASANTGLKFHAAGFTGVGFDVVFANGIIPPPPVADYTPYVHRVLAADDGDEPDVIACYAAIDCIPMYRQIQANGYKGIYYHTLYSDALLQAMAGTVVGIQFANFADPSPAMDQMRGEVKAVSAEAVIDIGVAAGYFSTSHFIDALKLTARKGKAAITPENVREAASKMTFEIEGLVGPTKYPESTVMPTPACSTLLENNGTAWKTISPYTCRTKTFPVK